MEINLNHPANDRFLRNPEVRALIGVPGNSGLYALMNHPDPDVRFPRPIKVGHRSLWSANSVYEWMERQKARMVAA